jgi:hypothetical protein
MTIEELYARWLAHMLACGARLDAEDGETT